MKISKSLLFLLLIFAMTATSCAVNSPSATNIPFTDTPLKILPITAPTFTPEATSTPRIVASDTPTPVINKTRFNLSSDLYLDENSSRSNLQGQPYISNFTYFSNRDGYGRTYRFGNEEWVTALTWTRVFPFDFNLTPQPGEELRQHYIQVWKDGKMLYSVPVEDVGSDPKDLLLYQNHWIFWYHDIGTNLGQVVQDGIPLNDLYGYDSAFSIFLLDGKPFFFFKRDNQFGIYFNNEEIILPYSKISYAQVCCENGGSGVWNPRATDIMVGFYTVEDSKYRYVEIGLR